MYANRPLDETNKVAFRKLYIKINLKTLHDISEGES